MAMESVLKQLESRIEELVGSYQAANTRAEELGERVEELEKEVQENAEVAAKLSEFEQQRDAMAERLEKVLGMIDSALEKSEQDDE